MVTRRNFLPGLFAVLLALMAQLGSAISVPRQDSLLVAFEAPICHSDDGSAPAQTPVHPGDCAICPLCAVFHAPSLPLPANQTPAGPTRIAAILRAELPPPSRAPPAPHRPPSQPRAPPIAS